MKDSDWEILYELYKTPNITKVSNQLYISQPSLTKRLQIMEEEFQIKIVKRTTKGVEFTKEGEFLAGKAKEYMVFFRQVRRELKAMRADEKEMIVIGASYTYSKYVLTDLLFKYSMTHPDIRFEVQNEQSNLLFKKACDGDVDVAFIRGDYDGPVIQKKIDTSQAYILTRDAVELARLPEMPRIGYKTNDKSKNILNSWWEQVYGMPVPAGMNAGYVDVAWQLASKGLGYVCCFLPEDFENSYRLTMTPMFFPDKSPVVRNTWFVYKDPSKKRKELCEFIAYMEERIASQQAVIY